MKTKIGELDKGTVFIKKGIWYKKLNERFSGRSTQGDGCCAGLSQFGIFTFFGNNSEVELGNEPKGIFVGEGINKRR